MERKGIGVKGTKGRFAEGLKKINGEKKDKGKSIPCSGPGTNSTSSLSSSVNNLSCGPNHDLSCGSVRGLSGRPPRRTYPRMAVRLRREGWIMSYTRC